MKRCELGTFFSKKSVIMILSTELGALHSFIQKTNFSLNQFTSALVDGPVDIRTSLSVIIKTNYLSHITGPLGPGDEGGCDGRAQEDGRRACG
jgi:hypothetical protein